MNILNDKNVSNKKGSELIKSLKKTILLVFALVSGIFCRDANSSLTGCLNCLHIASRSINTIDRVVTRVDNVLSGKDVEQTFKDMKTRLGKDLLKHFDIDLSNLSLDKKSMWNIKNMDSDSITDILQMEASQIIGQCFDALTAKATGSIEGVKSVNNVDAVSINHSLRYLASMVVQMSLLDDKNSASKELSRDVELLKTMTFSTLEYVLKPLLNSMRNFASSDDYTSQIQTLYSLIAEIDYDNEAAMNKFDTLAREHDVVFSSAFRNFHTLSSNVQKRASDLVSVLREIHEPQASKIKSPRTPVNHSVRSAIKVNNVKSASTRAPEATTTSVAQNATN